MLNNKLNNKGFAVSVILYSIAAVIIIVLLLIVSVNSANVHNTLNMSEKIKEDVSDKLPGNQDGPNSVTCSIGQTWEYDYTGGAQIFITPCTGVYKIEAYGASGQGINSQGSTRGGGKGTYVFGNIEMEKNSSINMYIGGAGTVDAAGYNGGGAGISGSGGGGGATDIRINGTALSNRVLVAGGGGGGPYFSNRYNPYDIETMEYGNAVGTLNSTLGKGTDGIKVTYDSEYFASGGGGGGYYGGYSNALLTYNSTNSQFTWQGGGSSYINTDYFFNYENNTLSDITYTGTNGQSDLRSNNVVYYKNSGDGKVIITYMGTIIDTPTAPAKKCIRATTLHTETCSYTSSSIGCNADGYGIGGTITYGSLGTKGTLTTGDAFDCDVDGDGTYSATTERFYYVTDMDSNAAVLIYYNNVSLESPDSTRVYKFYDVINRKNNNGPVSAIEHLPTTTQWKNVSLIKPTRAIKNEKGGTTTTAGTLPTAFSYSGYAARLLAYEEVNAGCYDGTTDVLAKGGLSSKCKFLMENTKYSTDSMETYGTWIETPNSSSSDTSYYVYGIYRTFTRGGVDTRISVGVRPAIEVLKSDISY